MTDTISKLTAVPQSIANDGSETSVVSATILTDSVPAAAGVTVDWSAQQGELSATSSVTDANSVASVNVQAVAGATTVSVTAATADDAQQIIIATFTPLAAPVVVNATSEDGYTLDHYDINFGVQAEIPLYDGVAFGQTVTFYWGDVDNISFIVTENEHPPFIIDVSEEMSPDCLKDGSYKVYYIVTDQAGNQTQSSTLTITVADGGSTVPTLPEPEVPEADPYININDANDGVDVIVSYPAMATGDVVTLFWAGYDASSRQISGTEATAEYTVQENDTTINFTVTMDCFYPNGRGYEGYAEAYYTVKAAGQSVLVLSDTKKCLVDTLAP